MLSTKREAQAWSAASHRAKEFWAYAPFRHYPDQRSAAVRRFDVLDTPPDGDFDRITAIAARRLGVPILIISIVDEDRIWFKSHHGVPVVLISQINGLRPDVSARRDRI